MKVTQGWSALSVGLLPVVLGTALGAASGQSLPQPTPSSDWSNFNQPAQPAATQPAPTSTQTPPVQSTPEPSQPPPPTSPDGQLPPAANLPPSPAPTVAPPPVVPAAAPVSAAGPDAAVTHETETPLPSPTPATVDASAGDRATERLTSSSMGPVGLYHVESADIGAPNLLRLGLYGQYFRNNNFPVLQANDDRSVGILTLAYAPLKYLDIYGGTQISSNVSYGAHGTTPNFVGELGDFWLGVKGGGFVAGGLAIGGDLRALGFAGVGTSGVGAGAFQPSFLLTYDALQVSRVPIRLHLNLGGFFGNLNNLTTTNAQGQAVTLRAPEQFALNYTPYNQFRMGIGFELPLPDVTPFIEYEMIAPISHGTLVGPDQSTVSYGQALPDDIDFGLRVTALRDISFLAAVDIAFQERVAIGVPILPPWEAYLGVSYNWDPVVRGSVKTIEKVKTVAQPVAAVEEKGQIGGTVVDAETSKPIGGAFITVDGTDLPPVASSATEGRFLTYGLRQGPANLTVTKDGYPAAAAHAFVDKGKVAQVSVTLKAESRPIPLHLKIHSAKGKPTGAAVAIHGPKDFKQDVNVPDSGEADATLPNPGAYTLEVAASGFLASGAAVTATANQPAQADVALSPKPKHSNLTVSATKIVLKKQLHFEGDKSEILPDSFAVLDEVVDAIVENHIGKLRVEGHTDNQGSKEHNLALSQERADAVKAYLEKAGISADRIEAVGYGDTKPIAPNFTNRGRALNRRTEFDVL